jgi:hypothetical protein
MPPLCTIFVPHWLTSSRNHHPQNMTPYFKHNDLPRTVPLWLKLYLIISAPIFWFGLLFSMIGIVVFATLSQDFELSSISFHPDQTTNGKIDKISPTRYSENKRLVFQYDYEFKTSTGTFKGRSFSVGYSDTSNGVQIEYESQNPLNSRIVHMDRIPLAPLIILALSLFPTSGLIILFLALLHGFEKIKLLTNGFVTTGTVVNKKATKAKINKRAIHKITFEYKTPTGRVMKSVCNSTKAEKLIVGEKEELIYDPREPKKTVLINTFNSAAQKFLLNHR